MKIIIGIAGLLIGMAVGGAVSGALVRRHDAAEAALRARYARALWRVAERCAGHDEAVRQWREAVRKEP